MKVSIIGGKETITGFSLTGIKDLHVARNGEEARRALKSLLEDPDMGIILITEDLAEGARGELAKRKAGLYPILIEIPDKRGPGERDSIRELIKRTVGLDIKGRE